MLFDATELAQNIPEKTTAPDLKNSHSEIEAFNSCERRHFYGYGLRIRPNKPGLQLVRGSIGHASLARYYSELQGGNSHKEATRAAFAELSTQLSGVEPLYPGGKLREDLSFTLDAYFKHFESESRDIEVLGVEREFIVRINDNFQLPFVVDLILRTPEGIEAWDHKFVWDFYNPNLVDLSPQLPLYYAGLKMLGYPQLTVRYNELRYRVTEKSKADLAQRFNRPAPRISPSRILTTMAEHIKVGERIYALRQRGIAEWEQDVIRAKNNMACRNCDFAKICIGELNGDSRDDFIGIDYVAKEPRK